MNESWRSWPICLKIGAFQQDLPGFRATFLVGRSPINILESSRIKSHGVVNFQLLIFSKHVWQGIKHHIGRICMVITIKWLWTHNRTVYLIHYCWTPPITSNYLPCHPGFVQHLNQNGHTQYTVAKSPCSESITLEHWLIFHSIDIYGMIYVYILIYL